ncbi:hypothetical protein E2562_001299 [Oryza meyeriana var. granulata]|uniref:Uncharacterized protein n=1 Tax=Oryza meyeriana var. granulata TaxID=110450 RepID=A0A6G1DEB3_9ORYZ|nr:hypothetical protein E2562_001299 [Oryza meyeriana var. granulata]
MHCSVSHVIGRGSPRWPRGAAGLGGERGREAGGARASGRHTADGGSRLREAAQGGGGWRGLG